MVTTKSPPIIVISGAIGSGKGTIIHALSHELDLHWLSTHTTRPVRKDDATLSRHIFDTEATFLRSLARGEFLEITEVAGHRYGTVRSDLEKELKTNHAVVMEANVDGGLKIAQHFPHTFLIFVAAPEKIRHLRIAHRAMGKEEVKERMRLSNREEKLAHQHYDFVVENPEDQPQEAIEEIKKLILDKFSEIKETEE